MLFDAVVIGTGFGGAVAACRLTQAGKSVCILERGRRYEAGDFPRPARRPDKLPHTARWAWALDHGLWDVRDLQGTLAVQAAGYGGGSLVYANVHLRAPAQVFSSGWPAAYTRGELDPYHDVVAAVLRVRPLPTTPSPASGLSGPLPKREAMLRAATRLGRAPWFFLPPLAIDFDRCVMCGECVAGCQIHAKNTLDLNYLAVAERQGADVRTLAEAVDITEEADAYTVRYRDHITGVDGATVRGRSVFLCAGAVNSTHILLRSTTGLPTIHPRSKAQIGRRFFGNGDAIAMVYDTKAPAPTPTLGPTITATLLYNGATAPGADPREWFVLQDGGYPRWLEPIMGLFRGDLWLGRNRRERPAATRAPLDAAAAGEEARAARTDAAALTKDAGEMLTALRDLLDARRALRDPGPDVLARGLGLDSVLPPQIRHQLAPHVREFVRRTEEEEARAVSDATLKEVSRRVREEVLDWLVNLGENAARRHVLPATLEILHRHFLKAPHFTRDPFTLAILWPLVVEAARKLFVGRRPGDRAFLMLGVGIDLAPGRLALDDEGRLLADWDLAANTPLATVQERLMHDVASELGGELWLNPDWTAHQRPVTVHGLGGCAMADTPDAGVTDPDGKVWGTRALYVLDGAAIPASLGANPSATIAAVAERNVRKALGDPSSPIHTPTPVPMDPPLPGGPSLEQIRRQLGQTKDVLDPIAGIPSTTSAPRSPTLGLTFDEVMAGFYRAGPHDNLPVRAELVATIDDLNAFLVNPRRPVGIAGRVWLGSGPGQGEVEYRAAGTLELLRRVDAIDTLAELLREGADLLAGLPALRAAAARSRLDAQRRAEAETQVESLLRRLEKQAHRYEMTYDLRLTHDRGPLRFRGVKTIDGGPGPGAWTDTTTLAVELFDAAEARVGEGTMRVHLADFLGKQLPSFRVTGTDDDVRIAWAFGRFFRFFLGTLRQVYVPHLQTLDPFGDRRS